MKEEKSSSIYEKSSSIHMIKNQSCNIWYKGNIYHREDGPAIEYMNGHRAWFVNGLRHREDGPAVECANGTNHWWLYGKRYETKGEWFEALPTNLKEKNLFNLTFMLG